MKNPTLKFLAVAALSLGSIAATQAATVNAVAVMANTVQSDNVLATPFYQSTMGWNGYVGAVDNPAAVTNLLFSFYLPTLTAGESFSSFTFSTNSNWTSATQEVDMYGLGTQASFNFSGTPYYSGTNDTTPGVVKLQSSFLNPTTVSDVNRPAALLTSTDFSTYINSLYTSGVPSGQYVVLRFNQQAINLANSVDFNSMGSESLNGYNGDILPLTGLNNTTGVFTQDSATTSWAVPFISYTVVPEPTTWALLASSLTTLFVFRRRRA